MHDSLTGLPNRVLLLDRLNVAIGRSRRRPNSLALPEADAAMYRAKQRASGVELHDSAMSLNAIIELETERQLRGALERGDLRLH